MALATAPEILAAGRPEELFGGLVGRTPERLKLLEKSYAAMLASLGDAPETKPAQERLQRLYALGVVAVKHGQYGRSVVIDDYDGPRLRSAKASYRLEQPLGRGDVADLYRVEVSGAEAVLKVVRDLQDADLLENEATLLKLLDSDRAKEPQFRPYVPQLLDSFSYRSQDGKGQANAVAALPGFYSLEQVQALHPGGLHWRDVDWILRRLLVGLGYAHQNGVVHGAVVPSNVLVHPSEHGLVLVDWCYGVSFQEEARIKALAAPYQDLYPPEVLDKARSGPATDIYMAAKCAVLLLAGDVETNLLPDRVPAKLRAFLASCLDKTPARRPQDAWELKNELDELLGERDFHPLVMPPEAQPLFPEDGPRATGGVSDKSAATAAPESAAAAPEPTSGPAQASQTPAPSSSGASAATSTNPNDNRKKGR